MLLLSVPQKNCIFSHHQYLHLHCLMPTTSSFSASQVSLPHPFSQLKCFLYGEAFSRTQNIAVHFHHLLLLFFLMKALFRILLDTREKNSKIVQSLHISYLRFLLLITSYLHIFNTTNEPVLNILLTKVYSYSEFLNLIKRPFLFQDSMQYTMSYLINLSPQLQLAATVSQTFLHFG